MASFFDDPDSDNEDSYRSIPAQPRASSSRAPSTVNGNEGYTTNSIAPTSPSNRSRAFSLIPGTESDARSLRDGESEIGSVGIDLDLEGDGEEDNDVKRLGRCWVKERGTGDIMPWEGDLIDQVFDKLEQQVSPRGSLIRSITSGGTRRYGGLEYAFWNRGCRKTGFDDQDCHKRLRWSLQGRSKADKTIAKDGQYLTGRSTDLRRRAFQIDARANRDGEGQVPSEELCENTFTQGKSSG